MKTTQKAIKVMALLAMVVVGIIPLSCGKNPVDGGNGGGDQVSLAKLQATRGVGFKYTGVFQYLNYVGSVMAHPPTDIIGGVQIGTPNLTWIGTSFTAHYFKTTPLGAAEDTTSYDISGTVSLDGKKITTLTITDKELIGLNFQDLQITFMDIPFKFSTTMEYDFELAGPGTQLQSHVTVARDLRIQYSQRWPYAAIATADDWKKYWRSLWGNTDQHNINIFFGK